MKDYRGDYVGADKNHLSVAPPADPNCVIVSPAVAALMTALPPPGAVWPVELRKKFMVALEAVIDLTYPTDPEHTCDRPGFSDDDYCAGCARIHEQRKLRARSP